jgi:hypothetical protein
LVGCIERRNCTGGLSTGHYREFFVRFNMSAYGQITCSLSLEDRIKG